jgi:hypothetical protein
MNIDKRDKGIAFDYLVKNAPVNSLQEVLNNILSFFNFKLVPDSCLSAIQHYHHSHLTLMVHKRIPIILSAHNFLKNEGGFKCSYINIEVDPETNKRGKPKKYNIEISTQAVISIEDVPEEVGKSFTPHQGVFNFEIFDPWLNSFFPTPTLQKHSFAKNTPDTFVLVLTLKLFQKPISQFDN